VKKKVERVKISTYLSSDLMERLKMLSDQTRVPQAAYFREAVEDLLKKYEATKKQGGK
jgi:predicted DNA-binding protein